jgi:RNA ligase (TIGR02306 family)
MTDAVQILTVKKKVPLFKGEDQANAIEIIQFEETGFEVISQKGLHEEGGKAVYIQPDYSLSDIPLFESFIRPNGDASKSRLGSNNRIRAIKFNLHRGDGLPVFSQGVILPLQEVADYLKIEGDTLSKVDLTSELGITKWEAPEEKTNSAGLKQGASQAFPAGLYKTDEENINNVLKYMQFPVHLVGTEKVDGSSVTIYYKSETDNGICSRNWKKPLSYEKITGRRKPTLFEKAKMFFGIKVDLNVRETVESDSEFVLYGKQYLNDLKTYYQYTGEQIALRGELNGKTCKGSGNKNNPARNEEDNIKFFGVDIADATGQFKKASYMKFLAVTDWLIVPTVKEVFNREFKSKEELIGECESYFRNNMIEGIVVRNLESTFSAKIMNLEYDSKK